MGVGMATATLYSEIITKFLEAVRADPEVPSGIADGIEALFSQPVTPSTDELLILLCQRDEFRIRHAVILSRYPGESIRGADPPS